MIQFCPSCDARLRIPDPRRAATFTCPKCGDKVRLGSPAPSSAPGVDEPAGSAVPWLGLAIGGSAALVLAVVVAIVAVLCNRGTPEEEIVQPTQPLVVLAANEPGVIQQPILPVAASGDPNKPVQPALVNGQLPDKEPQQHVSDRESVPPPPPGKGGGRILGQTVTFLGSVATGKRFCIIADRSGSMGGAMEDLKKEMIKTLQTLQEESQFHVIFFHSVANQQPYPGWLKGKSDVSKMETWINSMGPTGGTQPQGAFDLAFKLDPPPDVIFFMTDGIIPANVPAKVKALNSREPKVVVNTIMFAFSPESMLLNPAIQKQIAANPALAEKYKTMIEQQKGRMEQMNKNARGYLETIAQDSGGAYRTFDYVPNRSGIVRPSSAPTKPAPQPPKK